MQADAPSDTAMLIGRCLLLAEEDPDLRRLLAEGEAALIEGFLGDRARRGWFARVRKHRGLRGLAGLLERAVLPGISPHYLARKRWIERQVREGLARGIRQLVVVGAGFDTLALRLSREHPELRCFELDHPATQAVKRAGMAGDGGETLGEFDAGMALPAVALAALDAFDPGSPAVVVAEGLSIYFDEARVKELLSSMAEVAGPRGRVVFSYMSKAEDGGIGFRGESRGVGWWLKLRKEPFRWGIDRRGLPAPAGR